MRTVKNCLKLQLLWLLAIACTSCQSSSPVASTATPTESRVDTQLVLNNAVLEQSNKQENTVWKIKADNIVYSEDKKTAVLDRVVGNLLQNDEIILKISSDQGEIRDNGNIVILEDRIVASDPRNGSVMRSNSIEWRPQESLLLIEDELNAVHPKLEVNARQGRYYTDTEILEIEGDVSADTAEPTARLKSDRLLWQIKQNLVTSPNKIKVVRYGRNQKVTDRLTSDRAELDLLAQTATLNGNIELISLEPKIQAASQSLVWNYQQRVGKTESPIQIVDRDRQITVTGNQGELDFPKQLATLTKGAQGINQKQPSQLYASQLTWRIDTETIEALGNVIYEQTDPPARLTGEKAIGTLGNNNITVTSNGKQQVTSVIDN